MQRAISSGVGEVTANYSSLIPLASDASALLSEINVVVAAGQISASNLAMMIAAVNSIPTNNAAAMNNRIHAALLMVMASPEYITQK